MGRKKIDIKIRLLIENCLKSHERSLFFILGRKARDQVVILHHIFCSARNQFKLAKPSILWCFKKDNGFNFICHKTQRLLKKKYSGNYSLNEDDCFDHFLASSNIQFCHYNDTTSILGQTFDMLIVQDFEAITPNILSCIIESIAGGGVVIFILSSVQALQEIPTLKMDAHSRYITAAYSNVQPVFNSRFVLSLADCKNCLILDDCLKILLCPASLDSVNTSHILLNKRRNCELHVDATDALDKISSLCCTADQNSSLRTFITTLKAKCEKCVTSLTSPRGRGKSAALGLAIASALYLKYSHIYVTSPQLENLQTLFTFVIKGMNAFDYKEGKDYIVLHNKAENRKLVSGISIFHDYKQLVHYLTPTEFSKAGISDLVVIDEAAAIPLPIVKNWLKLSLVFMASTVNGYEGTGRSLSLKLLSQLREQSLKNINAETHCSTEKDFILHEISLNEAIRYSDGDNVERWMNNLFCLDTEITYLNDIPPEPESCQLYYVDKKVLFSYQKVAERFLQQLIALFVSSHYKNSPNDLLMMADAPSHHIFCLLPPVDKKNHSLPNVLCAIQIAFEGKISQDCVIKELSHGKRASGDMIPWIVSQQFQDDDFPALSGVRIVRIATHPNYQRMGYGQQALHLLSSYYEKISKTDFQCENIRTEEHTLLLNLNELEPKKMDYIGVSYGLTLELLRFWKKLEFFPLYLRQTASETTGEHSCVMIKSFNKQKSSQFSEYLSDFLERFLTLLTSAFQYLSATLALEILHYKRNCLQEIKDYSTETNIHLVFTTCSIKRLEAYCNHLVDYHLIMDLIPIVARCYFSYYFKDYFLSSIQEAVLLSMGLQNKSIEKISIELNMETNQVMGLFMKTVKKLRHHLIDFQKNVKNTTNLEKTMHCSAKTQNSPSCNELSSKRKYEKPNNGKIKKLKCHKTQN